MSADQSTRAGDGKTLGVPAGFALVPVEPTEEMLTNVEEEVGGHCHSCTKWNASWDDCRRVYAAMLAAAPAVSAPAAVPMCSEQAVLHALTMARSETHQQGDAALWQAFGRAMWRQFNAMLGAPAWQPIETAPRDEIVLLLPSKHSRRPSVGRWRDFDVFNHPKFTHWMRIPAVPEFQAPPATVAGSAA